MDIEAIFSGALRRADPAERTAYLDEVCGDDAELRRRVEALLKARAEAGEGFLDHPTAVDGEAV